MLCSLLHWWETQGVLMTLYPCQLQKNARKLSPIADLLNYRYRYYFMLCSLLHWWETQGVLMTLYPCQLQILLHALFSVTVVRNARRGHDYAPANFKKPTMDDLPVPSGSWQDHHNAMQAKYNKHLILGTGFFVVTLIVVSIIYFISK
ncbi:hypothetical protein J6590_069210 [Homalodisca vitripennis]|nr:hypothetical protein J6590_069210 [Homalodisca vitripennis]